MGGPETMYRAAARAPGDRGMDTPPPSRPRQAAQQSTPWERCSRARRGSGAPQTAQASSSGSYPVRQSSRSSKTAFTKARGFFKVSNA